MLSLPDCTVLLGKKNLHLSKILLWSPLDFPTFKNLFKLDSSEDGSFRFWNIILLDVEYDYNLSSRINMKTVLILFKFSYLLVT